MNVLFLSLGCWRHWSPPESNSQWKCNTHRERQTSTKWMNCNVLRSCVQLSISEVSVESSRSVFFCFAVHSLCFCCVTLATLRQNACLLIFAWIICSSSVVFFPLSFALAKAHWYIFSKCAHALIRILYVVYTFVSGLSRFIFLLNVCLFSLLVALLFFRRRRRSVVARDAKRNKVGTE